jgi:hypothetical protein
MNLLADESVDFPIVVRLRLDGHAAAAIAELAAGIIDRTFWRGRMKRRPCSSPWTRISGS